MKYINLFLLTSVYSMNNVVSKCNENDQPPQEKEGYQKIFDEINAIDDNQYNLIYKNALKIIKDREELLGKLLEEEQARGIIAQIERDEIKKWRESMNDQRDTLYSLYGLYQSDTSGYQEYQNFLKNYDEKESIYHSKCRQRELRTIARKKEELAIYKEKHKDCPSEDEDDIREIIDGKQEFIDWLETNHYKWEKILDESDKRTAIRNEDDIEFRRRNPWIYDKPEDPKDDKNKWYNLLLIIGGAISGLFIYKAVVAGIEHVRKSCVNPPLNVPTDPQIENEDSEDATENDISEDVKNKPIEDINLLI